MAGLLERALRARERSSAAYGADGVPQEDKAKILADIDGLFRARRVAPPQADRPRKHGLVLPIAANAIGAAVLVAGLLAIGSGTTAGYAGVERNGSLGLVAEARVIEEMRRATNVELSERERRIAEIRAQLEVLSRAGTPSAIGSLPEAERGDLERRLAQELAALESDSARRLVEYGRQRTEVAFFLAELRGIYSEARDLAVAGKTDAARTSAAAAEVLLGRADTAITSDPELSALLREGNAALDAALLLAEKAKAESGEGADLSASMDRATAEREAAEASAKAAELRARQAEKELAAVKAALESAAKAAARDEGEEGKLEPTAAELSGVRQDLEAVRASLAARDLAATERRTRTERVEALLSEGVATVKLAMPPEPSPDEKTVLALLDSKLRLRQLAVSADSASTGTGMEEELDRLFGEIASEGRRAGEESAFREASLALDALRASLGDAAPARATHGPAVPSSEDAAAEYLARLDRLLADLLEMLR